MRIIQYAGARDVIDLGWGHPPAWALPTGEWAGAVEAALSRYGWRALTYGYGTGPEPRNEFSTFSVRPPEVEK